MSAPVVVALIVGLFLGANGGLILAGILAQGAKQDAYKDGFFAGLKTARENLVRDIIASDTATTGADRRPAA